MRFFIQIITQNTFISGLVVLTFLPNNLFQVKEVERKLQEAQKCLCDCKEKVNGFLSLKYGFLILIKICVICHSGQARSHSYTQIMCTGAPLDVKTLL